jgi:MFS transporter, DHA1 family, tetracycline resistance protein
MSNEKENQQLWIILLIVFIGFIGTSIAYPIFPPLFLHPTHGSIIPASWNKNTQDIFLGLALAAYPLGQFIGSPILGGCSDRYGRKRMLILSLIGSVFGYFFSALSLQFNCLWALLLSRLLTGLMEGNLAIVRAMATDLESISKYKSLGRIDGMSAIGYVTGPLFGGFLSDNTIVYWFSFAFPFFVAMLFSIVAVLLAAFKLSEKPQITHHELRIWQRFNLISRFKLLFRSNNILKYLLIISTIFTFSVDIFYEIGPIYLTGLFSMTPSGIAIYNAALSFTLAVAASWLAHHLSLYFSPNRIIPIAMLITAIILGLMALFPSQLFVFILFAIIGLSIATVTTNMTIQVSNSADKTIQGEVMGTQLSLRMLGDAIICFTGGFLIILSVILPIAFSALIATSSVIIYIAKFKKKAILRRQNLNKY